MLSKYCIGHAFIHIQSNSRFLVGSSRAVFQGSNLLTGISQSHNRAYGVHLIGDRVSLSADPINDISMVSILR